jgi:CBS domain containing-hemolysin-like protein
VACSTALVVLIALNARDEAGRLAGTLAAAGLLVLAEMVGRPGGRKWSSGVLIAVLPVLHYLAWPLRPLQFLGQRPVISEDQEPEPEIVDAAREEIRVALEDGTYEGAIEEGEKEMIEGILKFGDAQASEVMTPRTEMECIDVDLSLERAAQKLASFRHSRIPVYEGTLDSIVGVLYVRDLLSASQSDGNPTIRDVMREPYLVPETKTVSSLLHEFQREHIQIGVIVDEYGGVCGLVTVEDIMEEIVGEIEDESDMEDHESRVVVRQGGEVEVDGRIRIDEINEDFEMDIPEDQDYDTVAGFATSVFGRLPQTGETAEFDGLQVHVLQSDERRVRRVLLHRTEEPQED